MRLIELLGEAQKYDGKVDGWLTPVIDRLREFLGGGEDVAETMENSLDGDIEDVVQRYRDSDGFGSDPEQK